MDTAHWGWIIIGFMALANFWISISVVLNCLKKLDRCETKLMAMTEAYPHQAMIEMQREGIAAQREISEPNSSQPDGWMSREVS